MRKIPLIFWRIAFFVLLLSAGTNMAQTHAQQAPQQLYQQLRARLSGVKDYKADVRIKVDVTFLKMPALRGVMYYKAPDKLRLDRQGGVSLLPKKSINFSIANLLSDAGPAVLEGGYEMEGGINTRIIKVVPEGTGGDVVLARLWVDETRMLVLRTEATTRDNGTVSTVLQYGKYVAQALPDKILFVLDVKDFKMPKGVTMDYDNGSEPAPVKASDKGKRKKGRIEITYLSYIVNSGLSDALFAENGR